MSSTLESASDAGACVCLDLGTAMSKASLRLPGPASNVAPLPIGVAAGAEHALLTPSAMYVDDARIFFGPSALKRAWLGLAARRSPIVSFKLVLSAREIEPTLALKISRSVDPTSTLRHRDALVLYLAYLDQLVRAAVAGEAGVPASAAEAPRRLTSPHWQAFGEAGRIVSRLVEESVTVSSHLGCALVGPEGVQLARVRDALAAGESAPARGRFGGVVFESHSAAAAYASFACAPAPYVLVIDMGAGTTDIAGFETRTESGQPALVEISRTRQCCALAGDELDNILVDFYGRAGGRRRLDAEDELWRALQLSAQELKRDLFQKGRRTFSHGRRRIHATREAFTRDASFKAFCRALTETIAASLAPVMDRAAGAGADSVAILLAGGGASLPFLGELVRAAAARCKPRLRLDVERFGANWSLPYQHHPLAGAFPQMAIAMGGAVAPVIDAMAPAAPVS